MNKEYHFYPKFFKECLYLELFLNIGILFLIQKRGEKYVMKKTNEMCSLQCNNQGMDVIQVKLADLHAFKNHPFKVEKDQALFELRQSIESEGILVPY